MNISTKRLEEIQNIPDEELDTSDIPELDAHFWENAKLVQPITKQAISLIIDSDVLQWFKFVVRAGKPASDIKGAFRLPLSNIFEKLGCSACATIIN
ncbi:MAG: hypothetical protein QNJ63_15405 [Calothrix sp. MO_192.B10]|nr:hypothetical protein [Calothrix sp. MO_192.B10]